MSNRQGKPKIVYTCAGSHATKQRADKEPPKKCAVRGCDERPMLDEVATEPEILLVATTPAKKKGTRKKVTA